VVKKQFRKLKELAIEMKQCMLASCPGQLEGAEIKKWIEKNYTNVELRIINSYSSGKGNHDAD